MIDLGSRTGLSSSLWCAFADKVMGIEPTLDWLNRARMDFPGIDFRSTNSYQTGLDASCADVVACTPSFHWPVHWDWEAERAYETLFDDVERLAGIALSQGQIQKLVKTNHTGIQPSIDAFRDVVGRSTASEMTVSYRMMVGVK